LSAPLTVLIPTLNAATALPGCAAALMEGLEAGLIRELIVSDGGSEDATRAIAEEIGAVIVTGPPGSEPSRGGQLRRGAEAARGAWLLVVHADTQLPRGWAQAVRDHLATGRPAAFRLGFDRGGIGAAWVAGWANLRSRVFGLPYGDQALLVSMEAYRRAGGYPDIPLMEDVALVRALPRVAILPLTSRTSAGRYAREGWVRRGARNLWTYARYRAGADPHVLSRSYRRTGRSS